MEVPKQWNNHEADRSWLGEHRQTKQGSVHSGPRWFPVKKTEKSPRLRAGPQGPLSKINTSDGTSIHPDRHLHWIGEHAIHRIHLDLFGSFEFLFKSLVSYLSKTYCFALKYYSELNSLRMRKQIQNFNFKFCQRKMKYEP